MRQLVLCFSIMALFSACAQPVQNLSPSSGGEEAAQHTATPEGEHGAAAEGGEHGEKKAKPPEKPKPDSVISSVLALPVVKKWGEWMESRGNQIVAWGEYVKTVKGAPCWSIVVAEETSKGTTTNWKRFCMQQTGLEMWVESSLGASNTDEINYITYDSWMKNCEPTYNSPGKC